MNKGSESGHGQVADVDLSMHRVHDLERETGFHDSIESHPLRLSAGSLRSGGPANHAIADVMFLKPHR